MNRSTVDTEQLLGGSQGEMVTLKKTSHIGLHTLSKFAIKGTQGFWSQQQNRPLGSSSNISAFIGLWYSNSLTDKDH